MLNLLEKVASRLIKKYNPVIICITGSVGKTSAKDAIASCLGASFRVRKTPKNLNNEFGVPISIIGGFKFKEGFWPLLGIVMNGFKQLIFSHDFPDILVIEVGAGKVGEVKRVSSWLKPDILVVTNLPDVPSHLGVFGSKEKIIQEKKYLGEVMDHEGKLFIEGTEKNIDLFTDGFKGKIIEFNSRNTEERINYSIIYKDTEGFDFPAGIRTVINIYGKKTTVDFLGFLGVQNIKALVVAKLVAQELGCEPSKIIEGLKKYIPEAGRLRILPGKCKNVTIVDDSFNSSPIAVENSLINFLDIKKKSNQRKIAVLGDMLNLGIETEEIHRSTATKEISQVDILLTVGDISKNWQFFNSNKLGLNKHFRNSTNLARYLEDIIEPGDMILFKGGHFTRLEKAVKILADCSEHQLVRQEGYWQKPEFELYNEKSDYE